MPYNPLDSEHMSRLMAAVKFSRTKLEPFRRHRLHRIRQFVGSNYSDDGAADKVPTNLLELAIGIYIQRLAANAPRVLFTSDRAELKPDAASLTLATDRLMDEINLADTLQRWVNDALFGWGIIKVGLAPAGKVEVMGYLHDATQPFADVISLDSWVHDINARSIEMSQFMGDRYEMPIEWVKENDTFKKDVREKVTADQRSGYGDDGEDAAREVSRGEEPEHESYREMTTLWDLWLPMDNLVVTVGRDSTTPLRVVEWDGPEAGPYHFLGFRNVPDNVMPLPPTAVWIDLHELGNALFRKLGRQAERQKDLTVYRGGAKQDAETEKNASDGDLIQSDQPDATKTIKRGGADPATLAFYLQLKGIFTYMAGNLDMLGGLAPQSQTLGQDELLSQSAGNRLEDMRAKTEIAAGKVIFDLAKWLYNDPLVDLPLVKRVPGTGIEVPTNWTPEQRRESDFLEYNFKIVPYSMQHVSPSARLVALQSILQGFILPAMPMLQQQGIQVNAEALLKKWAKYAGIPEDLDDVLTFSAPPQTAEEGGVIGTHPRHEAGMGMKPAFTKRTYERVNRPGATPGNADAAMAQLLMGGDMQMAEAEAATRPTG